MSSQIADRLSPPENMPPYVPDWFYCIQSADISACNVQCVEYCSNASGHNIEACHVQGANLPCVNGGTGEGKSSSINVFMN